MGGRGDVGGGRGVWFWEWAFVWILKSLWMSLSLPLVCDFKVMKIIHYNSGNTMATRLNALLGLLLLNFTWLDMRDTVFRVLCVSYCAKRIPTIYVFSFQDADSAYFTKPKVKTPWIAHFEEVKYFVAFVIVELEMESVNSSSSYGALLLSWKERALG